MVAIAVLAGSTSLLRAAGGRPQLQLGSVHVTDQPWLLVTAALACAVSVALLARRRTVVLGCGIGAVAAIAVSTYRHDAAWLVVTVLTALVIARRGTSTR